MKNVQEERLMKALELIDVIELRLRATVALINLSQEDEIDLDDISLLLRASIEECRHDI